MKPAFGSVYQWSHAGVQPKAQYDRLLGVPPPNRRNLPGPLVLHIPRVDDSQAGSFKRAGVSRCNNQAMAGGRCCNVAVCGRYSFPLDSRTGTKHRICCGGCGIKGQDSTDEQRQDALLKTGMERVSSFARCQRRNSKTQLRQADR